MHDGAALKGSAKDDFEFFHEIERIRKLADKDEAGKSLNDSLDIEMAEKKSQVSVPKIFLVASSCATNKYKLCLKIICGKR